MDRLTTIEKQFTLDVPSHWLPALINGDVSGLDGLELEALEAFAQAEIPANAVLDPADSGFFSKCHDATLYGVLACECHELLVTVLKTAKATSSLYDLEYSRALSQGAS